MGENFTSHMPPTIKVWAWQGGSFEVHDAVQYDSTRSLENPVAVANIMLKGDRFQAVSDSSLVGKKYDDVFELYDLVQIRIRDRNGIEWVDVLGVVHAKQQNSRDNDGIPSKDFSLEVRSISELARVYQIFWHPQIPIHAYSRLGFKIRTQSQPVQGRPDQMLKQFYELFINDRYLLDLADGRKLNDAIKLDLYKPTDGGMTINKSGVGNEASLLETLQSMADKPFNLFYSDVPTPQELGRDKQYGTFEKLYLRKTPFNPDDWAELAGNAGYDYDGSDLMEDGENLRLDADHISNVTWAYGLPLYGNFDQVLHLHLRSNGRIPRRNEDSIRRFGARSMSRQTIYMMHFDEASIKGKPLSNKARRLLNTKATNHVGLLERRSNELYAWFGFPRFYHGTIETALRIGTNAQMGVRVGSILRNHVDKREYFLTQIDQSWRQGDLPTTSQTVERGHSPDDLAAWLRAQEKEEKRVANVTSSGKPKPKSKPVRQGGRPQETKFDPVTQGQRDALKAALAGTLQHPAPANVSGNIYIGVDYGYTEWPSRNGKFRFHKGVDMNAPLDADLLAVEAGVVEFSGVLSANYGETVIVKHTHQAGTYYSVYAHCNSRSVEANQAVARGEVVAKMGRTGNAVGVHIHFEIRLLHNLPGHVVDPIPLLSGLTNSNGGPFFGQAIIRKNPAPY